LILLEGKTGVSCGHHNHQLVRVWQYRPASSSILEAHPKGLKRGGLRKAGSGIRQKPLERLAAAVAGAESPPARIDPLRSAAGDMGACVECGAW
jgi:hypothetical protein